MSTGEWMTIEEIVTLAKERGVPGPDVAEHEEGYDGECYCRLCLSYYAEDAPRPKGEQAS